jgi:hypothetical protein
MVIPLLQVVCGQASGGVSAPPGAAFLAAFRNPFRYLILLQKIINGFSQQNRLGNAGPSRELHEQLMLVRVEIHGMHLAFRSAHVSTLANGDDEMKPY